MDQLNLETNHQKGAPGLRDSISVFKRVYSPPAGVTDWMTVLDNIKSDRYKRAIEKCRLIEDIEEYRKYKQKLPAVTFSGVFEVNRQRDKVTSATGFIIPDLDHLDNIESVFDMLKMDPHVWFAFRSPSGEGIKCGIRANGIKTDDDIKKLYDAVEWYFEDVYGIEIDSACKDISRLTFVSHDPDLFVSPDPIYFNISEWQRPRTKRIYTKPVNTNGGWKEKFGNEVLKRRCDDIRQSLPSNQHCVRLRAARTVGGFIGEYINEGIALSELGRAVSESGAKNMKAAMKTVRDGIEYGKASPIKVEEKHKPNPAKPQHSSTDSRNQVDHEAGEWDRARELFPRIPLPWEVLPPDIAHSLQQLARSHATSALSLPGAAMAIFSSVLGSTINVSPKKSWKEPLILWVADIRPSGSGKTPAARALCRVLYQAQTHADQDYQRRYEIEQEKKPSDRRSVPRARGYFNTDLTLEGLRADISGHGGTVCVLDELSSFLSAQNQYKSKGNDRESWLCMWDGKPFRVVRAGESFTVSGARVNIFGGVQPRVWQMVFGGEKGMFLEDGTIFRFLPTFEGNSFYPLDGEAWSDRNRGAWEHLLTLAMEWADEITREDNWKSKSLCLDHDAQAIFFGWRNELTATVAELPWQLRGFIPKATSYALRISGALYGMNRFALNGFPAGLLKKSDIDKGISVARFYLGHIVDAMLALCGGDAVAPVEITDQVKHLAKALESMRGEIESGRLAVGHILERFNDGLPPEQIIESARAMGTVLRECGLTIPVKRFRIKNKTGLACVVWDKKTESFLKTCQHRQPYQQPTTGEGLPMLTKENRCQQRQHFQEESSMDVDKVDEENPMSTPSNAYQSKGVANVDKVDVFSKENEKTTEVII